MHRAAQRVTRTLQRRDCTLQLRILPAGNCRYYQQRRYDGAAVGKRSQYVR
eukprot:COSAG06_NODE_65050_length_258_cov_0.572327_1_plen_50_part_10